MVNWPVTSRQDTHDRPAAVIGQPLVYLASFHVPRGNNVPRVHRLPARGVYCCLTDNLRYLRLPGCKSPEAPMYLASRLNRQDLAFLSELSYLRSSCQVRSAGQPLTCGRDSSGVIATRTISPPKHESFLPVSEKADWTWAGKDFLRTRVGALKEGDCGRTADSRGPMSVRPAAYEPGTSRRTPRTSSVYFTTQHMALRIEWENWLIGSSCVPLEPRGVFGLKLRKALCEPKP